MMRQRWDNIEIDLYEDLVPVVLFGWLGVVWSFFAGAIAVIWDLDQSWFDRADVPPLMFLVRVILFFPVWGGVQAEHALVAVGWDINSAPVWIVLMILAGALPMILVGVIVTWWKHEPPTS